MLSEVEIRKLVDEILDEAEGQCNRTWFVHRGGVLRGLLWALNGQDPGNDLFNRTTDVCDLAGIRRGPVLADGHYHTSIRQLPEEIEEDLRVPSPTCHICNALEAKKGA